MSYLATYMAMSAALYWVFAEAIITVFVSKAIYDHHFLLRGLDIVLSTVVIFGARAALQPSCCMRTPASCPLRLL
jgi:hypothetical protein